MKKQLFLAFGAAALLASCSNENDSLTVENIYDGYLHVRGTINEVKTRATDTSFENGNQIGVSGGTFENIPYTYNGSTFAAAGEDNITVSGESVTFAAYYPYSDDNQISDKQISFDLNSADQNCDFLWASASASQTSPVANFTFNHMMSQVSFVVVDKTSDNSLKGQQATITLKNVATKGKFNITSGVITVDEGTSSVQISNVSPVLESEAESATGSTVILPSYSTDNQTALKVTLAIDEKTFSGEITPALKAGTKYSYTLTVEDGSLEQTLTISNSGINGWTPSGDTAQNIDMVEDYVLQVGDFLLADGTTIAPKDYEANSEKVVAVVYYIAEGDELTTNGFPKSSGLAIAINNANDGSSTKFAGSKFDFPTWVNGKISEGSEYIKGTGFGTATIPTELLGYNYTKIIKEATTEKGGQSASADDTGCDALITLLENYDSTYPVQNASSWYVPSYGEFTKILENYDKVSSSVEMADGTLEQYSDFVATGNSNCYWVSDMRNATNNWVHPLAATQETTLWKDKTKAQGGFFRFAIAF